MAAAAFGNLLLNDQPLMKYLLLTGLLAAAVVIYLPEIRVLMTTALELAGDLVKKLKKKEG